MDEEKNKKKKKHDKNDQSSESASLSKSPTMSARGISDNKTKTVMPFKVLETEDENQISTQSYRNPNRF